MKKDRPRRRSPMGIKIPLDKLVRRKAKKYARRIARKRAAEVVVDVVSSVVHNERINSKQDEINLLLEAFNEMVDYSDGEKLVYNGARGRKVQMSDGARAVAQRAISAFGLGGA